MKKSILRLAVKFINKDLKKQVTFEAIELYLNKIGYLVMFYGIDENWEILDRYDLLEYSKSCDGLTLNDGEIKIVFINKAISSQDMLYALLHETAHVILKHLERNQTISNKRLQEMEAETFTYAVLNPVKSRRPIYIALLVTCFSLVGMFVGSNVNKVTVPTQDMQNQDVIAIEEDNLLDEVFVTPSGTKYHVSTCRYIKDKDCSTLTVQEARKKYAPCSVCQP